MTPTVKDGILDATSAGIGSKTQRPGDQAPGREKLPGDVSYVRPFELAAAINRIRSLTVMQKRV